MWYVYIVFCNDQSLYTGMSVDVERRVKEHNSSVKGAKSLRYKRPVQLVYCEEFATRRQAAQREWEIKQWKRSKKLVLIQSAGKPSGA